MKRDFLLAVMMTVGLSAWCQQSSLPKNEFTIGVGIEGGDEPVFYREVTSDYGWSPMERYHNSKYITGDVREGPTIDVSYRRKISSHFFVGGYLAYKQITMEVTRRSDGMPMSDYYDKNLMLLPALRYYIWDNRYVRVYAEAAAGIRANWLRPMLEPSSFSWEGAYQFTFAGVDFSIASKLKFFGEIGAGHLGICRAGVGYRF